MRRPTDLRSATSRAAILINVLALIALVAIWLFNGRDDTWFYLAAGGIVLTSLPTLRRPDR